jgi:hypothetical protein
MRTVDLETVTHVAACAIQVGDRVIQRCCVCGEKLADTLDPNNYVVWKEGELVTTDHGFFKGLQNMYQNMTKLPRNFCDRLVER